MRERVLSVMLFVVAALLCAPQLKAICPAPPDLTSPVDGSSVPFGLILLDWDDPAGAVAYDVYLALDDDPLGLHDTTVMSQKLIEVEPGRSVEWKVVAKAPSCPDAASVHFMFDTTCPEAVPILQNPDPGQHFAPGDAIEFNWTPVPGAAGYDVRVTPDFGQTFDAIAENLVGTSFVTDDLPAGDWGWHVRANFDGACEPAFSEPSFFLIDDIGNCDSLPTTLIEPANGATGVDNPVTFRWAAMPNADKYTVFASIDGGATFVLDTTPATNLTETIDGRNVTWVVATHYAEECPPAISEPSRFSLGPGGDCPPDPQEAALVSPPANATNLASPVTFDWNPVPQASGYQVLAIFEGDREPTSLGFTDQTSLTAAVPAGKGLWFVQTFFGENCARTLSERRAFTVTQGAACDNAKPVLVSPANGATNVTSPATFQWNPLPRAIGYALFVAINDDVDFELYGVTEGTELERLVPEGVVHWFVLARFAGCDDVRSDVFHFTVGDASCGDPQLTLTVPPDDAQVTSPVTLAWNPVPNTVVYRVLVTTEDGATAVLERTNATAATLQFPAGEIRWRVEALRANDCPSVLSEERRFTVTTGANCASNLAPTLIAPVGTEEQPAAVQARVNLQWNAVANAIGYQVWIASNDQPFGEVAFTRETHKEVEVEPGKHAWRVFALYEGCDPVPSAIAFFAVADTEGCSTEAPTVLSPAPNEVVDSPVTITWAAVAGVEKYRVIAQIKGEGPFLLGTTEETQISVLLPLSDDPGDVIFLVQAVFEDCVSTQSERVPITVRRSQDCTNVAPTLVSPSDGATNVAPVVDFVWTPVSGAIKYVLIVESNEGNETIVGTTEDSQLTRPMPPGRIEWRVAAFFPGCDPVQSDEFEFDVARPENCGTRKPVLIFPKNDREVTSPVHFAWTGVPNAIAYRVRSEGGGNEPAIIAETTDTQAIVELGPGTYEWGVDALFESCPPSSSGEGEFRVGDPVPCGTPEKPNAQVIGRAVSASSYRLRWTSLANVDLYEIQESTSPGFENAQTSTTDDLSMKFAHEVTGTPVQYLYRVRGVSNCNDERGPYSDVVGVFVVSAQTNNSSAELGDDAAIVQRLFLPGGAAPLQFVATADKPWLTVTPSSGILPVEGLTLTVTANPQTLPIGTNTATIAIQYTGTSSGGVVANDTTTSSVPFSVSLVTPVEPGGTGTPPPDALIFGAVGHAQGQGDSLFESDVRLTNLTAQTMQYQLHFTPSGTNGTQNGLFGSIEVAPGSTIALDDVVASMFGEGTTGGAVGMLEVRPATTTSSGGGFFGGVESGAVEQIHTAASSRTYNFTPTGTFGQFIPATRFGDFVGRGAILSLQQVAQSAAYRANFGFLEASGHPVDMAVRVYDTASTLLATIPVSLQAMEHRQLNLLLLQNGITDLTDGRVEVEVMNGEGRVTAYVSEVDNATNDPLLVSAEQKGAREANRYALPGIATFRSGSAFWVSDVRIFNAGTTSTPATLTFYPMGNPGGAIARDVTIDAGEIEVLNNVLANLFGQTVDAAGAIIITTPAVTKLTATARTYNQTDNGTFGQYIPAVTVAESVGALDRALQILQVEQSSRFRTNIGVQETSGQAATVEVSLITPDSLTTPVVTLSLAANEFRQFGLVDFHPEGSVYNGRVSVKVIGGLGRVTAYGSAIDSITQDPTYVPAQ